MVSKEGEERMQFVVPRLAYEPGGDWRVLRGQVAYLGRGGARADGVLGLVVPENEWCCYLYLRGTHSGAIEDVETGEWVPLALPTLGNGRPRNLAVVETAIDVGKIYRLVDDSGCDIVFTTALSYIPTGSGN